MQLDRDLVQMNERAVGQLSGLAGRLVAEGLVSAQIAGDAQSEAAAEKVPFVQYLVEHKAVNSQRLAEVASHEFGARFGQEPLLPLFKFVVQELCDDKPKNRITYKL